MDRDRLLVLLLFLSLEDDFLLPLLLENERDLDLDLFLLTHDEDLERDLLPPLGLLDTDLERDRLVFEMLLFLERDLGDLELCLRWPPLLFQRGGDNLLEFLNTGDFLLVLE